MRRLSRLAMKLASIAVLAGPGSASPGAPPRAEPVLPGLESRTADVGQGVVLHYWTGGSGPAVVLLHGWPETGYAWRKIAPQLAAKGFRVIVPDLRGFGGSSRPEGGYDRLTMAEDVRRLVRDTMKIGSVLLVGHDWGGSTAAAWALAHPDEVKRLVVIEAQPRGPWSKPEPWFYAFHRAPGFAEAMTAGRERTYLSWFYRNFAARPDAIGPEEVDIYLRSYGSPEGMRPGFELVRALPKDVEVNSKAATHPVSVPTLAIGGGKGMGAAVGENLKPLFSRVDSLVLRGVGHFVPEEAPDELLQSILPFLSS